MRSIFSKCANGGLRHRSRIGIAIAVFNFLLCMTGFLLFMTGCSERTPSPVNGKVTVPEATATASDQNSATESPVTPEDTIKEMEENAAKRIEEGISAIEKAKEVPNADVASLQKIQDQLEQVKAGKHPLQIAASKSLKSSNNLKAIGLALMNYESAYKRFPATAQLGPNGVPHSWRVAVLPFLDLGDLYAQYRQDEPWDSEENKKVLAQMPEVFRDPSDALDSTNSAYFVLVGPETIFDGGAGCKYSAITDGTSNTILAVEAKRKIPWTKPEDIPFDSKSPMPELGGLFAGGFHVILCDGSVRSIPDDIDPKILQYAIMRADGNEFTLPEFLIPLAK